jgi:hypothetical protein
LLTCPHVLPPQVGGVHAVHTPLTHWVSPVHFVGQAMLPLPQAFDTFPQDMPPSVAVHSGGSGPHSPPMHV